MSPTYFRRLDSPNFIRAYYHQRNIYYHRSESKTHAVPLAMDVYNPGVNEQVLIAPVMIVPNAIQKIIPKKNCPNFWHSDWHTCSVKEKKYWFAIITINNTNCWFYLRENTYVKWVFKPLVEGDLTGSGMVWLQYAVVLPGASASCFPPVLRLTATLLILIWRPDITTSTNLTNLPTSRTFFLFFRVFIFDRISKSLSLLKSELYSLSGSQSSSKAYNCVSSVWILV